MANDDRTMLVHLNCTIPAQSLLTAETLGDFVEAAVAIALEGHDEEFSDFAHVGDVTRAVVPMAEEVT